MRTLACLAALAVISVAPAFAAAPFALSFNGASPVPEPALSDLDQKTTWTSPPLNAAAKNTVTLDFQTARPLHGLGYLPATFGQGGIIESCDIRASADGTIWKTILENKKFREMDYAQYARFPEPVTARYVELVIHSVYPDKKNPSAPALAKAAEFAPVLAANDEPLLAAEWLPGRGPWGLINISWNLKAPADNFQRIDYTVTIDRDIPDDARLYISVLGGKINNCGYYGGIQTRSQGWNTKADHTWRRLGRGAIFSRWFDKKYPAPEALSYADGDDGVTAYEAAGYEGDFVSVRTSCPWSKGSYTYSIIRGDTVVIDGEKYTWARTEVRDHQTGKIHKIGALRFPGEKLTQGPWIPAFAEHYGARIKLSDIPKVTITYDAPVIDGKPAPLKSVAVRYQELSRDHCDAEYAGGKLKVTLGSYVPHDKRSRILWQAD